MIDRRVLLLCVLMVFGPLVACAGNGVSTSSQEQIRFGVSMARSGLWSEALFRFQQANQLEPRNAKVLNNIAVAYEAVGQFDRALATYQEAIAVAPGNPDLRRNYSRFVEFYQSFKPPAESTETTSDDDAAAGDSAAQDVAAADRGDGVS